MKSFEIGLYLQRFARFLLPAIKECFLILTVCIMHLEISFVHTKEQQQNGCIKSNLRSIGGYLIVFTPALV